MDAWFASILAQTQAPDEIVIVNGGSLDGTLPRLAAFAETDPRVTVLQVPRGSTIATSRNAAIRHTQAAIVAVADGGTLLPPHWLEWLVRPLLAGKQFALVGGPPLPGGPPGFQRHLSHIITPHESEHRAAHFLPGGASMAFPEPPGTRSGASPRP